MQSALLLCSLALAAQAAFEVASIKPAQPVSMNQKMGIRMQADAGILRYTNVSLRDCIRTAYRVKDFQVQGPDWLGAARFDVTAKLPAGASRDQVPDMLQALLAERFHRALHRKTEEHGIYALVAGKNGPKLKAAEAPKRAEQSLPGGGLMMMRTDPGGMRLQAASVTLAGLAEMLSRFTERPVMDRTGIPGQYDFELVFAPETTRVMPMGPGPDPGSAPTPREPAPSIYEAVRSYGLKLEPGKAQLEVLVVDHIDRLPTEN